MYYYTKNKIESFIKQFNFPDPDWKSIPQDFPNSNLFGLNQQDKHLYKAIITMWNVTHPYEYFENLFMYGVLSSTSIATLLLFVSMFLYYADVNYNLGLNFLTEFFA